MDLDTAGEQTIAYGAGMIDLNLDYSESVDSPIQLVMYKTNHN